MTMAEKILASHANLDSVTPGQIVVAKVDRTRLVDMMIPEIMVNMEELGIDKVWDPNRVVVPIEHQVPPSTVGDADAYVTARKFVQKFGIKNFFEIGRHGICHVLMVEEGFVRPGELIAANDSHTCTYGALNAASRGIGPVEMIYLLKHGKLWFKVPETILFKIDGKLNLGVYSKDIILYIAGKYGTDIALYKSAEFVGSAVYDLSLEEKQTIANMGIEIGAKFALFEADDKIIDYVKARTSDDFTPVNSDSDAKYSQIIEIDASNIEPQVACPHDISNSKPVAEVRGVRIDQAFLGSCTNGRIEDLRIAASILRGYKIAPWVRMIVIPASMRIYRQAMHEGLFDVFLDAGCIIDGPTCGPCGGGGKGLLGAGECGISTTNRNFKGRMGSTESEVYLASPATVAASAIEGYVVDPRLYLSQKVEGGKS